MRFISENVSKLIYLPYLSGLISMISVIFLKSFIKPFQSIFPITLHYTAEIVRRTHLDNLTFVSNIDSTTASIQNLNKSFLFRTHTLWNSLPFDIRSSMRLSQFKIKLAKHLWSIALSDNEQPEHEWSFQSSDEGD